MITTIIICLTVIFCVVWITGWATHMSTNNLPMFTYGECTWEDKVEGPTQGETNPIGFTDSEEPEQPKAKTDKEQKEAVLKDPITMFSALLRGEVDIDDVTN